MKPAVKMRIWPTRIGKRLGPLSICADILVLILGLTSCIVVHLVGDLPVSEILLIPLFPILVALRPARVVRAEFRPFYLLMALWLVSQVATDVFRRTAAADWMRGDAKIIYFGVTLVCFAALMGRNARRKVLFIAGYSASSLLMARFQPSELGMDDPWKFGYATGVTLIVLLVASFFYWLRWYPVVVCLLIGIAGVHLKENFRSPVLFLLVILVLAVPVVPERLGRIRILPPPGTVLRVLVLAGMAVLAGAAAEGAVHYATRAGLLGEDAEQKNEQQSQLKGGLLLGGRPEILVSSQAVMDSPILGHGSWARDYKYTEMLSDIIEESGGKSNLEDSIQTYSGLIPSHSHLMGAWVEAGILGALFWMYAFWQAVKALLRVAIARPPLAPLYSWLLVVFLWDVLFSPFGTSRRGTEALVMVLIVDVLESGGSVLKAARRMPWQQWRRMGAVGRVPAQQWSLGSNRESQVPGSD